MSTLLRAAVELSVFAPLLLVVLLGLLRFFSRRPPERVLARLAEGVFLATAAASATAAILVVGSGRASVEIVLGDWFHVSHESFSLRLAVDAVSLSFGTLAAALLGLVARFSASYLHRERGYFRYFFLLSLLGAGVMIVALAGSLALVIFGWELVGIASALLIAFFHDRPKAVRHGFLAFATYRICDFGILAALTWLHHTGAHSSFVVGEASWHALAAPASASSAHLVAFGLVLAAAGKSAQFPVSGWLPRAMEGPTPSSAIFYGALSVHLGPVLLLRAAPVFEAASAAAWTLVGVGAVTAAYGLLVGRAQADVKSRLAYASMTQVGLIFAEIGLGLHALALVHVLGHATLRGYEILRAPSVIRDREEAPKRRDTALLVWFDSTALGRRTRRFAIERAYVDPFVIEALRRLGRFLREVDRRDAAFVERLEREVGPLPVTEEAPR